MKDKIYLISIYISLQLLATMVSSFIWYGFDQSLPLFGWAFLVLIHVAALASSTLIADEEGLL